MIKFVYFEFIINRIKSPQISFIILDLDYYNNNQLIKLIILLISSLIH